MALWLRDRQALVRYIGVLSLIRNFSNASPKLVARRTWSVVGQACSAREKWLSMEDYRMSIPIMLYGVVSLFFIIAAVWALLLFWGIQKKTSACAEALEDIRRYIRVIKDKGSASL